MIRRLTLLAVRRQDVWRAVSFNWMHLVDLLGTSIKNLWCIRARPKVSAYTLLHVRTRNIPDDHRREWRQQFRQDRVPAAASLTDSAAMSAAVQVQARESPTDEPAAAEVFPPPEPKTWPVTHASMMSGFPGCIKLHISDATRPHFGKLSWLEDSEKITLYGNDDIFEGWTQHNFNPRIGIKLQLWIRVLKLWIRIPSFSIAQHMVRPTLPQSVSTSTGLVLKLK